MLDYQPKHFSSVVYLRDKKHTPECHPSFGANRRSGRVLRVMNPLRRFYRHFERVKMVIKNK